MVLLYIQNFRDVMPFQYGRYKGSSSATEVVFFDFTNMQQKTLSSPSNVTPHQLTWRRLAVDSY